MRYHFFLLFIFTSLISLSCISYSYQRSDLYPNTIVRIQQHNYTGSKNKSFSDSLQGYSGGISLLTQKEFFVPYVGINFGGQSARQTFLDGTKEITSNYNYQYGSGEAGLYFFPIGRQTKGLNLYINAAGLAGYHSIALKNSLTLSSISKTDQNFSAGYKGNVGFEWILKNKNNRLKWTIYAEVGFKKESLKLLKQNFLLDSLKLSFA
jgi:hypothetical protein